MLIKKLFKKEEVSGNDTGAWIITTIKNGLKCEHISRKYVEYFEVDELAGINAFKKTLGMTPLQVFDRLLTKTPFTRGFVYKKWDIVIHEKKGFIIRLRVDSNSEIEEFKKNNLYERYRTNESLQEIEMIQFLAYIEENYED
jgi:hypothetical protein